MMRRIVLVAAAVAAAAGIAWAAGVFVASPRVTSIERTSSYRDPVLLAEAERLPVARAYLTHAFEYQHNPTVCGPTSAADLLHSLGRSGSPSDVMTTGGITTVFGYVIPGLTLDQEAALLRRTTGLHVALRRDLDLRAFRAWLSRANDPRLRLIVNFTRGPMFGRGHGHFSPVLAYLADRDLVLVGDVNRDYGIYLVTSRRLFDAMNTVDDVTGRTRGLLAVSVN